ncbi:O-antigen ligase family protein [Anoxybacillus geothermalis]|nr:O-antigen ligase family protein [Anoxybacillus geothermalis]
MSRRNIIVAVAVAFLTFFDFLFPRIQIGPLTLTLLRVILLALFSFLIAKQLKDRKIIVSHSGYINAVLLFLITWILYGLLQTTWAIDKTSAIKQVYYLGLFAVLIYTMLMFLDSIRIFVRLNQFLYCMAVFFIVYGVAELTLNIHFPTSRVVLEPQLYHNVQRATAVFYNENDFSFYLVLVAPMFLLNIFYKKRIERAVNLLFFIMIFYIVMANDSRVCLIALFIQVIAGLWLERKTARNMKYHLMVLVLSGLAILTLFRGYLQHAYELIMYQLSTGSGSAGIRRELISKGIEFVKNSYLLGIGPGNFETNVYVMTSGKGISGIFNAHNWWIELVANYGLFIFVLYAAMFMGLLVHLRWVQKKVNSRVYSRYASYFLLSFIGFIFSSLSSSSIFYIWYQWLHLALALSLIDIYHEYQANTVSKKCINAP